MDCEPGTEVTNRVGFAAWLDRTVELHEDGITRIMSPAAKHCGNVQHQDIRNIANAFDNGLGPRFSVNAYGWSNTSTDKMIFSVDVPAGQAGGYKASLIVDNDGITAGNTFSITGSGGFNSVLVNVSADPAFIRNNSIGMARNEGDGFIVLDEGINQIEVVLNSISSQQASQGASATRTSVRGIQVGALELLKQTDEAAFINRARQVSGEMAWVAQPGRWGLMVHHSSLFTRTYTSGIHKDGKPYPAGQLISRDWSRYVDLFDVEAFADKVDETGADYVVFTVFHGSPLFPGPSPFMDSIMPGLTAERDLIKDLGNELESRGKRLALYFHTGKDSDQWLDAMGYNDFNDIQRYNRNIISLQEEWAKRYNGTNGYPKLLSTAMYFDTVWAGLAQRDFPWVDYFDAVKAPDALPDSIIGLTVNRFLPASPLADIFIVDSGNFVGVRDARAFDTPANRRDGTMLGIGPGHPMHVENGWFYSETRSTWNTNRFDPQINELVNVISKGTAMGGPVIINLKLTGDVVAGVPFMDPASVAAMARVSAALKQDNNTLISQGRPATQSNTDFGGVASRAVDGNTNGTYAAGSVTHTAINVNNPEWRVDLGSDVAIGKIDIFNRTDCCSNRLTNFRVDVINSNNVQTWKSEQSAAPNPKLELNANGAVGRYVRVTVRGTGTLSLAEVQVYAAKPISEGRPATQSSTGFGGVASRAVDGNTNGNFAAGSVTHTAINVNNPEWRVDLGSDVAIGKIDVFNRTGCCSERLTNFRVDVINSNNVQTWKSEQSAAPNPKLALDANGAVGRYVRVTVRGMGTLSLAEVQVYAD